MTEDQLKDELDAVYSSTSWKITAPLRYSRALLKGEQGLPFPSLKRMLKSCLRFVARSTPARVFGQLILRCFPSLRAHAHHALLRLGMLASDEVAVADLPREREELLSPRGRAILAELRANMRKK